ncbi:unnamed protein product [Pelagomonas calceolata]|uniref:NAD(P)-binding domain-containing protein n=1 Tax=Pelagomonas calceolata TaxID=35677 RepID=A0A8J2STI7_9STRA|nr:unnamed protein product [Pelagomonas calceolata]|mmetsp:Transcript_20818/g.58860  ORF Transcript_20818/g.58860 Transcript_20818/m.58860 type:complete len:318 (-) Transcript_20818:11-964(-)
MNRLLLILTVALQYVSALQLTRRALPGAAAAATAIGTQNALAAAKPVLVLGANGGTGLECVKYLQKKGRPCVAATRTGEFVGDASKLVTVAKGDVTDAASLASLITEQTGAVIFAASASRQADAKKTSNAKAVDNVGLVNCAKLCIEKSVPRLVVVSSGGVSKPSSAVYIFLNLAANGIMDAKIAGEDAVRKLYAAPGLAEKNVGYTVVRPGGLLRDPGLGVSAVELNQGDTKSGRINRADVAAICIESLDSKAAFDTTFECYYADTAKGLDDVMKSNAAAVGAGVKTTPTETSTGRERRGDTWPKLFEGLERDRVA